MQPDDVSKKSLKVLDKKLEWLAEHADFDVSINSVVGAGVAHPEDALAITRRALELGFDTTVGTIHDHKGQLKSLPNADRAVYDQIQSERKPGFWAFAYVRNTGKPACIHPDVRIDLPRLQRVESRESTDSDPAGRA